MRFSLVCLTLFLIAALIPAYAARSFDANLSDDAFRLMYTGNFTRTGPASALEGQLGFLYHHEDHGRDDTELPHVGLLVSGHAGTPNVTADIGARFLYLNSDPADGFAFAPGGRVHYSLPRYNRIGFGAHVFFAPSVVSTNDLNNYLEYGIRADYEILKNAAIYVQYRQIKVNLHGPGGWKTLDAGFDGGLHITF
jgi:hypothetical protein